MLFYGLLLLLLCLYANEFDYAATEMNPAGSWLSCEPHATRWESRFSPPNVATSQHKQMDTDKLRCMISIQALPTVSVVLSSSLSLTGEKPTEFDFSLGSPNLKQYQFSG